ncbi:MAG: ATP-dependent helicase [Gemmataceae bacterium]
MRKFVPAGSWVPAGVKSLEANALRVVRDEANGLVVAGPGAGKTELLAQRACYLLQTGICRPPQQILAISFKKDAAANLQARVKTRCGDGLARRFHSLTFDAFAKSILDRFGQALPEEYRPTADYLINFDIQKRMREHLDGLVGEATGLTMRDVSGISAEGFYKREFLGRALPIPTAEPQSIENRAAAALWRSLLKGSARSQLDFGMIGRLAELLLRFNPLLLKALRQTYSHVFLDEFQDTTRIQYTLTRTLFRGSSAILTAVGDSKQRIMVWAGALDQIFEVYRSDFVAEVRNLVMNYRSAPELVRIQETLIAAIEPGTPAPKAADDGSDGEGECRVLLYPTHEREAAHLAELAVGWVFGDGVSPRDICVLTRNKPATYAEVLIKELGNRGVKARVETELQDLLVEPLAVVAMDALKLAVFGRHREAWSSLVAMLKNLRGLDDDDPRVRQLEHQLTAAVSKIEFALSAPDCTLKSVRQSLSDFFDFAGLDAFRRLYPQYLQGRYVSERFRDFTQYLWECYEQAGDWPSALDEVVGNDTVPIITVHKSKGLEYHTVVFVGLEDSALWNFTGQSEEEKRGFFVAFSRAKKRVLFTFCDKRAKTGGSLVAQSRKKIGALYDLLEKAGVQPETVP